MNFHGFANVVTTIGIIALATTLVLPKRQTPQVLSAGFKGAAGLVKASIGQG